MKAQETDDHGEMIGDTVVGFRHTVEALAAGRRLIQVHKHRYSPCSPACEACGQRAGAVKKVIVGTLRLIRFMAQSIASHLELKMSNKHIFGS
jgi:hypothetical protein